MSVSREFERLSAIIEKLHGPDGCPWDRAQTLSSLLPRLSEEIEEYAEAIEKGAPGEAAEELGDLLLLVLFSARAAEREGLFDLDAVMRGLSAKLVRRHPHVFGNGRAESPEEALEQWKAAKRAEKKRNTPARDTARDEAQKER